MLTPEEAIRAKEERLTGPLIELTYLESLVQSVRKLLEQALMLEDPLSEFTLVNAAGNVMYPLKSQADALERSLKR